MGLVLGMLRAAIIRDDVYFLFQPSAKKGEEGLGSWEGHLFDVCVPEKGALLFHVVVDGRGLQQIRMGLGCTGDGIGSGLD